MAQISEAIALASSDTMEMKTSTSLASLPLPSFQPQSMDSHIQDSPKEEEEEEAVVEVVTVTSFINLLCDDTLIRILSYADLPSLVYFTRGTTLKLRRRFYPPARREEFNDFDDCHFDIWREVFSKHNFAPVDDNARSCSRGDVNVSLLTDGELLQTTTTTTTDTATTTDYFNLLRQRLSLWSTLSGNSRRKKRIGSSAKQCFSLPSRLFHFVPLLPPDMMHYPPTSSSGGNNNNNNNNNNNDDGISFSFIDDGSDDEDGSDEFGIIDLDQHNHNDEEADEDIDHGIMAHHPHHHHGTIMESSDPPPVEFACDSFSLTSSGTGTEFVLLNPFSGSVEVYDSVLDNAISSDESMLEQAMMDASEGILRKRSRNNGGIGSGSGHNGHTNRAGSSSSRRIGGGGSERGIILHNNEEQDYYDLLADENSEVIAGEAIHNRIHLNQRMYDTPPKQVLFSIHDYFDLDISEYFGEHTPFANNGRRESGSVTVDWVGVDSHSAFSNDCSSTSGNIIGAARILTMEFEDGGDELACTEIFAWSNFDKDENVLAATSIDDAKYSSKYVCRAAGSFYFLDICANYKKLYAAFQVGCCPFDGHSSETANSSRGDRRDRHLVDIEEESMVNEDGAPIRKSKTIFCLPLIPYGDSPSCPDAIGSYFPTPDACMVAQYPVSSFSVDPSGKFLLVGTICGTVEIWHTGMDPNNSPTAPLRLQILSVRESFMKRHRSMTMDERPTRTYGAEANAAFPDDHDTKPSNVEFDSNATDTQDDLALLENGTLDEDEFPHKHPTSRISQIYLPRHLPVQQCGFIAKQRSVESGTTLLLWQTTKICSETARDSINERFHIMAMINLPLSAQCHPAVHFDGRRLIVFGKDHIGLIFLVYHVLGTRFDQNEFDEANAPAKASKKNRGGNKGEESGGIIHTTGERRLKFVNRIRHAGLGGLEYYDSMLLAANERFLVVNTKAGNLVGSDGACNASEGLLVIDLQECGCY